MAGGAVLGAHGRPGVEPSPRGILGALITFGRGLWYPIYEARTRAAGGDPLQDQQLAGLLMWIPAGVILMILGLALLAAWLGESERRARRADAALAGGDT